MKRVSNYITYTILCFVVIATMLYLSIGTYANDDWWACFFYGTPLRTLLASDQGQVWSWFTMKIFTHIIPMSLNIHPQQNVILTLSKGLNFAILIYLMSRFYDLSKKQIPNFIVILMNTILLFSVIFCVNIIQIGVVNQHYKYILNLILGFAIWTVWYREFLNDTFFEKDKLLRNCIFAVIIVFAGHIISIPSLIIILILYLYNMFQSNTRFAHLKAFIKNNYSFFLIYISCCLIYMNLPGFTYIRALRCIQDSTIHYCITHFWYYTKELFKYLFTDSHICGILIITLIGLIGLIVCRKREDIKYIVISAAILISNFVFLYTLLTCGTTFYDNKSYWFVSKELTFTFIIYLSLICNIVFGRLFGKLNSLIFKSVFVPVCIIGICLCYPVNKTYEKALHIHKILKEQQVDIYKLNKLFRYYALTGDTIYIPSSYYMNTNHIFYCSCNIQKESISKNLFLIYKVDKNKKIEEVDADIINENEFFFPEELQNIDFKNLYDDDLILMSPKPILKNRE